ncbi:MAG: DNA polymerase IV [Lachnospiraceae bacterium]|jgi:DNA polymerase-4
MMDRSILHVDCNCFYASVEMLYHPELRTVPMAVGGDPEARHGIILTANYPAKKRGVKTGMALWQAREACPGVVLVPPHMSEYIHFSNLSHEILAEYSDLWEPFGLDECWVDVTRSVGILGDAHSLAEEIRQRYRRELGITVSIGVSWNKIFAKYGSDYRKPDAITDVTRENYRNLVWTRPVDDLLYVGNATRRKLHLYGIETIGDLARTDPAFLETVFGKVGLMLLMFARGDDCTPVSREHSPVPVKSIGNSTTSPRDLETDGDVSLVLYILAESVASRLKQNGFAGRVITVSVRDSDLAGFTHQRKTDIPTDISEEIHHIAFELFQESWDWRKPVRSVGVHVSGLVPAGEPWQQDLFVDPALREKRRHADRAVDDLRRRFGYQAVMRGVMYQDPELSALDASSDVHNIRPHGYMERGNRTGVENYHAGSLPASPKAK